MILADGSRRSGSVTMKTSVRGSKSPSKADSMPQRKQSTMPQSPENGGRQLSYLNFRESGRYSHSGGRGSANVVNFLQKNRQAISRNYGTSNSVEGLSPPRSKIGQAPMIGDALGTPSNKGSSSFMSAGHYGVRDSGLKSGYKKREHNF